MPADVRQQLQATLSGSYTLERELTGGGMSRVFLAEETRFGRKVVVKVLSAELAASLSAERFEREIRVAASLQQANIVPVLSAGDAGGLPYYTMPFVEGESLRKKLADGPLSVSHTVGILKDVARALSFAHEHGIVHRDIKPDNVLISGGAAVVTDFGIAKAISASRTGPGAGTITQIGTAIGTPAYMAPEQAAADPDVDHRADIYSFGCLAYELLAGHSPFHDRAPHQMMSAHMNIVPMHVSELRPDTPSALSELVMRCLAKEPADRVQSATDILHTLDTMTSAGNYTPLPAILIGGRGMFRKALGIYAAAFVVVAILARAAILAIGLPDWVFPGALIVMALGLPVILFTAYVHRVTRQIAMTTAPSITPGGTASSTHGGMAQLAVRASPHVSWRRATMGGVYALGTFIVLVAGYMLLRGVGVGPIGSLLAKGTIEKNERLFVADFRSTGADTSLGPVITEAFRTGLGQSRTVVVMSATSIRDVLRRMQRDPTTKVDFNLAREISTREGIKAFVDGDVLAVGGKYLLSARLTASQTGETLVALQASADGEREILSAIDRLTKNLRERIGESLKTIRDSRPLEQVTTPSMEALRKYVQAVQALSFEGNYDKGVALLEEAISLDTNFAMAYRKLAVEMNNRGTDPGRVAVLISKALDHRDRLSDAERYQTIAYYYSYGPQSDAGRAAAAYESLLDLQPTNVTALNNLSVNSQLIRDFKKARDVILRAERNPDAPPVVFGNLASIGVALGDTAQVTRALRALESRYSTNPFATIYTINIQYHRGNRDSAVAIARHLQQSSTFDASTRATAALYAGSIAEVEGRVAQAQREFDEARRIQAEHGAQGARLAAGLDSAWLAAWILGDVARARTTIDRALAAHPLKSIPHLGRPYPRLVSALATVGRSAQAKTVVALFDEDRARLGRLTDEPFRHRMLGDIAVAERRYDDAAREYREGDAKDFCITCALPRLAQAYDLAGNADSAIAVFTRYIETGDFFRIGGPAISGVDGDYLAVSYKRLGELWEQKGDRQKALGYYLKFVDLWKNADPELQPKVAEVRRRIARLKDVEAK
jgi:tetratricopeptide (TPR) repeat protein